MTKVNTAERLYELDVFRGLAILSVLIFHFTTRYNQLYGHSPSMVFEFPLGYYGVHLFFIISGFVIFMSLDRINNDLDFIINRLSRLYPAYWFSVLLTFTIVHISSLPGRDVSFPQALMNLSMFQTWLSIW
jgi:peptidoglycan/LPS O-acetylase OafA/YrhL